MSKVSITNSDLLEHLKEQIRFILASAESFDGGFEGEAKRLAVVIRNMVYDTDKSTSLLTQLSKKDILFCDTSNDIDSPKMVSSGNGLVLMRISTKAGATYVARLDQDTPYKKSSFDVWWNKNVLRESPGKYFTRKDLVLNVANKEGGAHIDPKLDSTYFNLSRYGMKEIRFHRNGVEESFKNKPVLPSIRQIAHEILKTLEDNFPDLFD